MSPIMWLLALSLQVLLPDNNTRCMQLTSLLMTVQRLVHQDN